MARSKADQDKLRQANESVDDVRSRGDDDALAEASKDLWDESQDGGEDEPPAESRPRPQDVLRGFTAPTHWDGDPGCIDWYAAPKGTVISWPVAGTGYKESLMGPQGMIHTYYLIADDGYTYTFTHVLEDGMSLGRREAGDDLCVLGDSGIEHLPGNPAHIHFTASAGELPNAGPDGPTGNVPALERLNQLGFDVLVVNRIPGPQDYLAGRADAGRFV